MCLSCNSLCGKCRPPREKVIVCPKCGQRNVFTREQCLGYLGYRHHMSASEAQLFSALASEEPTCDICGTSLTETLSALIKPMPCSYSGIVCAYPCGRRDNLPHTYDAPCTKQVPLRRYTPANKVAPQSTFAV